MSLEDMTREAKSKERALTLLRQHLISAQHGKQKQQVYSDVPSLRPLHPPNPICLPSFLSTLHGISLQPVLCFFWRCTRGKHWPTITRQGEEAVDRTPPSPMATGESAATVATMEPGAVTTAARASWPGTLSHSGSGTADELCGSKLDEVEGTCPCGAPDYGVMLPCRGCGEAAHARCRRGTGAKDMCARCTEQNVRGTGGARKRKRSAK